MDAHQLDESMQWLIAAISELKEEDIPVNIASFAEIAESLRAQGNVFAARFHVRDEAGGLTCREFRDGIVVANTARNISYVTKTMDRFNVTMSVGKAVETLRRLSNTMRRDVRTFAKLYVKATQ